MKTLYDKQHDHSIVLYSSLIHQKAALDTSSTGTGKTVVAAHIAKHWQGNVDPHIPVAVVCPKAVITSWERELKEHGVTPLFVLNYEKLKRGRDGIIKITRKFKKSKLFQWLVPENTLLIFDEVQWCKGAYTQNDQMLVAARKGGYHVLCLSATAAQDPTEMRALGYVLGLHDLNYKLDNNSWFHWMRKNGCYKNDWGAWVKRKKHSLAGLNKEMFVNRAVAHGLKTHDLPEAFRANHVMSELLDIDPSIFADITREDIDKLLENIDSKTRKDDLKITKILRARQTSEALKLQIIGDTTNDLVAEGYSVVIFVNFRDSVDVLRAMFPEASVIIGGQPTHERDRNIDQFQNNETNVAIVTVDAGGTGLSLHDTDGDYPRVSLISPTFSIQKHKQVLGRAHRAGGKSDVLQKILVAANTVEEYVVDRCLKKQHTMEEMLG